jgi:3-methyladenine DNA glycosylase AlkC
VAEPLKNLFNDEFFTQLIEVVGQFVTDFDSAAFLEQIYDTEWKQRELKQRMRHVSTTLRHFLPTDYPDALAIIISIADHLRTGQEEINFGFMFLPDFIEQYGVEHFDLSIAAMEQITQLASCEFAVRPFLIKHPEQTMAQMQAWARHPVHTVRRFASEGCRPRLPWAMGVPALKKDPSPILPILEQLKDDPSEFVRRSVANNLNDISKDHPDIALRLARKWKGSSPETDRVIKHGCRTLLKQGLPEAMVLFGFKPADQIEIEGFQMDTQSIKIGDDLHFSFRLINTDTEPALVRLEYGIYYLRANGSYSRKVFKISENTYPEQAAVEIKRKQSFRPITTRRFYPGLQHLSLIVNGEEVWKGDFELEE